MRVVERFPTAMKIFTGRGIWALLVPVRLLCAGAYEVWLSTRSIPQGERIGGRTEGRPRIVSIGNLEVGGGGKTPCTIVIAEEIARRGGSPVVLTRGYKSLVAERRRTPYVVTAGKGVTDEGGPAYYKPHGGVDRAVRRDREIAPARLIGDEAELYRKRSIPVVIDGDRVRGSHIAERLFTPSHILLDDGFQNHSLEKDIDIVLLDAGRPFGCGKLLPYGTLREKRGAVRRADIVIFTRAAGRDVPREAADLVRGKGHFFARHQPEYLVSREGESIPLSQMGGKRIALFSGIARPDSFEELVERLGGNIDVSFRFIDHHRYRSKDVTWMLHRAPEGIAYLTTEKDWVKAAHLFPAGFPVYALRVRMEISDLEKLMDVIM
jgi:tetraacyldisaccharide 4'-kinase